MLVDTSGRRRAPGLGAALQWRMSPRSRRRDRGRRAAGRALRDPDASGWRVVHGRARLDGMERTSRSRSWRPARVTVTIRLVFCVSALLNSAPALAQASGSNRSTLPAVFVGAGAGPAANDAASRMRLYAEGTAFAWLVEAGAAVSPRIGIGVEYSQPSAATASTTVGVGRTTIAGREEERVLLGVLRGRLAGSRRVSLDALGGAGVPCTITSPGGVPRHPPPVPAPASLPQASMRWRPSSCLASRYRSLWHGISKSPPAHAPTSCAAASTSAPAMSISTGRTSGARPRGPPSSVVQDLSR